MKFKKFLESLDTGIHDPLAYIKNELSAMSAEELDEFGEWLYDEIFDDEESDGDTFDYDEIIELINSLPSEDLDYIEFMLGYEDEGNIGVEDGDVDDDMDDDMDDDFDGEADESLTPRFLSKNRNKKRNKKFTLSKAKFRAGKAARKKENRANRAERRQNYRKNKIKIKKYDKSYNANVKSGKHVVKVRR